MDTDVGAIFFNLTLLYHLNAGFCTAIEEAVDKWAEKDEIAEALDKSSKFSGPYAGFGAHYERGKACLAQLLESNSYFKKIFTEIDDQVFEALNLRFQDLFINPVQRPPRYSMLIRDLLKQTPETHNDRKPLEDLSSTMDELSSKVNEKIKETESIGELAASTIRLIGLVSMSHILDRAGGFERLRYEPPETLDPCIHTSLGINSDLLQRQIFQRRKARSGREFGSRLAMSRTSCLSTTQRGIFITRRKSSCCLTYAN